MLSDHDGFHASAPQNLMTDLPQRAIADHSDSTAWTTQARGQRKRVATHRDRICKDSLFGRYAIGHHVDALFRDDEVLGEPARNISSNRPQLGA
jgi:hypothetical protein